ncbi:alpha/beta hydrolase fold domain-containing protein [Paenibacillus sp. NPDC058071]|uniref:alpha/beta hydrolase fold domain-containing protein n=1 Tax=Paenibacillus sp. NPDC058071 TaxID=3346326 RepID=UPI0036DF04E6
MKFKLITAGLIVIVILGAGLFWFLQKDTADNKPGASNEPTLLTVSSVSALQKRYLQPESEVTVKHDLLYASKKNESEATEQLMLDMYTPADNKEEKRPVFIFIHGGGFREGTKNDGASFSEALAKRGYAVFSIDYRLKTKPEANFMRTLNDAYEDISDVFGWIGDHAEEYGLDVNRIAIGGDSAGGHLALNFVNELLIRNPEFVKSVFAIIDIYGGNLNAAVQTALPPVLIVHGTNDLEVPYEVSAKFAEQLDNKGLYHNFLTLEGIGHDYKNEKCFDWIVETTAHFLYNVMNRQEVGSLPNQTAVEVVSGHAFELKLPSAYDDLPAAAAPEMYLPKGWTSNRQNNGTILIQTPDSLERGIQTVYIASPSGTAQDKNFALSVRIADPLKVGYETFYDKNDRLIKTKVSVLNQSSEPFNGTVRIRYQGELGNEDVSEFKVETLKPQKTANLSIPYAIAGKRTFEALGESGVWKQRTEDELHLLAVPKTGEPKRHDDKLGDSDEEGRFEASGAKVEQGSGLEDANVFGRLSWDERFLYITAEATDDTHFQQGSGIDIWSGDSVQFGIGIANEDGSDPKVFSEMGAALGEGDRFLKWRWIAPTGMRADDSVQLEGGVVRRDGKTIYELKIPWEELNVNASRIQAGLKLKFSLLVNDNDGDGRKGWVEYNGGIGTVKDVHQYGDVFLMP